MKYPVKLKVTYPGPTGGSRVEKFAFALSEGRSMSIGRETKRLSIKDASVSKIHCKVMVENGKLFAIHESATSSTKVNGQLVKRARLRVGDHLTLGNVDIEVLEAPMPLRDDEPDTLFIDTNDETTDAISKEVKAPPQAVVAAPAPVTMAEKPRARPRRWTVDRNPFSTFKVAPRTVKRAVQVLGVCLVAGGIYLSRDHWQALMIAQQERAPASVEAIRQIPEPPSAVEAPRKDLAETSRKFFIAAQRGDLQTVRNLIQSGQASPHQTSPNGTTALMLSAYGGHLDLVQFLLNQGANLDIQDGTGMTAVMWAATGGQRGAMDLLVKAGASTKIKNDSGERVTDILSRMGVQPEAPVQRVQTETPKKSKKAKAQKPTIKRTVSSVPKSKPKLESKNKVQLKPKTKTKPNPVPIPAQRDSAAEFSDKFFGE